MSPGDKHPGKVGCFGTSSQVGSVDNLCHELDARVPSKPQIIPRKWVTMFYLIAIFLVMATPLAVPTAVSIFHAIKDWKQNATPAFGGAVPAAA